MVSLSSLASPLLCSSGARLAPSPPYCTQLLTMFGDLRRELIFLLILAVVIPVKDTKGRFNFDGVALLVTYSDLLTLTELFVIWLFYQAGVTL